MKQGTIIRAYKALSKLAAEPLPIKTACAVHRLRVAMRPTWEFQQEEEQKEINRLKPQVEQNGDLLFQSPEDARVFRDKLKELEENEVELSADVVKMPMLPEITISADDVDALEGFVEFTEG